ncbi:DUF2878 domain-containing protein [Amphibiibacter pelophylacis]|uniref:DUF2878 domain-containing protein n=1 Tax=Amphibiibacter pelophylacis TaxID=1799477 RepID=A0ACC6P167_9BURK
MSTAVSPLPPGRTAWARAVRSHPRLRSAAYFVLGQATWFACVLSIAHGQPIWGALTVLVLTVLHLAWLPSPAREVRFLLAATLMGGVWETLMLHTGQFTYAVAPSPAGIVPWWLLTLWLMLALQVQVLLDWLKGRWLLAAFFGAVGGALSFRGGAALGAVRFTDTATAMALLAAGWLVLMPALLALAQRWNGLQPASSSDSA